MHNFIGTYQMKDLSLCDRMVSFFNENKKYALPGGFYKIGADEPVIDKEHKESLDLGISAHHHYQPWDDYQDHLQESLLEYLKVYTEADTHYSKFAIVENYNLQHYPIGGGFKDWHFEADCVDKSRRVLVFMTFLNDVPDGGTMFKYQDLTIPAKKGLSVIWPAGFTHTHKGQISQTSEKIIATGWWSLTGE